MKPSNSKKIFIIFFFLFLFGMGAFLFFIMKNTKGPWEKKNSNQTNTPFQDSK